jgi:hypothetical protein
VSPSEASALLDAARIKLNDARQDLERAVNLLPSPPRETSMASSALRAILDRVKSARRDLDELEIETIGAEGPPVPSPAEADSPSR